MQLAALFAAFFPLLPARFEALAPQAKPTAQAAPAQAAPSQNTKPQDSTLSAERRELAALRLLVVADRKFHEAKERLVQLEATLQPSTADGAATLRREVRALLDEVRRALGENVASSSDRIDDAARRAIAESDWAFLVQIDKAAVPALREAVLATPDYLPSVVRADPLYYLFLADVFAANELCLELVHQEGFFWKRRFLRAFRELHGFGFSPILDAGDPREVFPGFIRQTEALVADPGLAVEAPYIGLDELARADFLTPTLRKSLVALLTSSASAREEIWVPASIYLELCHSADLETRRWAAEALRRSRNIGPEFLALAADTDAGVRRIVAMRLDDNDLDWSADKVAVLERLLEDEDAGVRGHARNVLRNGRLPVEERTVREQPVYRRKVLTVSLSSELLRRMAESPEVHARLALAISVLPRMENPSLVLPMLERLAADADSETANAAVAGIRDFWLQGEACLAVLTAALANSAVDRATAYNFGSELLGVMMRESQAAPALCWALARSEPELVRAVRLNGNPVDFVGIPPDLVRLYFVRAFEFDLGFRWLCDGNAHVDTEQARALAGLVDDASAPTLLRLSVSKVALRGGIPDQDLAPALRALCTDLRWDPETASDLGKELQKAFQLLSGERVNECLLLLAQQAKVPGELLRPALFQIDTNAPKAADVMRTLLETRFSDPDSRSRELASQALSWMGHTPTLLDREWLGRALRDSTHQGAALSVIGRLRDPADLPQLDELLRKGDTRTVERVIDALTNYLTTEAGELLLLAATKVSGEKRDLALGHLAKIREYQAAREEWATRKTSAATRAQVVAELVAKLDAKSEEVKVEAIRALATWEAVEAMPRLIELTQSGSKSVAAAAREALERLNAPKGTTGG